MKKIFFLLIATICSLAGTHAQPIRTLPNQTTYKPLPNRTPYKPPSKPPVVIKSRPFDAVQRDRLVLVNAKTLYVKVVLRNWLNIGSKTTVGNGFKFRVFGDERREYNAGKCVLTEVRPNLYQVENMTPEPSVNQNGNELTWTFKITGIVQGFDMGVHVTNSQYTDTGSYYWATEGTSWFDRCDNLKKLGETITVYCDYKFRDE